MIDEKRTEPEMISPVRYYTDGKPYVQIGGLELHDHPVSEACARLDRYEKYIIPQLQVQLAEKEELLSAAIAGQETLQKAFIESQRRERAAVEDIFCADRCDVCRHTASGTECEENDFDCLICQSETCICKTCMDEDKWQWRGPQEGEPYETV